MTRITLSTAFVTSLLAASAFAAPPVPQKRIDVAGNDNGACSALFNRCVKGVKKSGAHVFFQQPFGFSDQCTAAAICYDANVDDFLYDVYRKVPHGKRRRPYANTSARLTQSQYNRIAYSPVHKRELEARALATQQNFVDFFYTTLSRSGGPYPDIGYVTNLWSEISAWTGFCDSRSIPYGNLADWFQYYSSSNYSPSCGASTSVVGGTTTVNGGQTTVNSGTTTVIGGTTSVMGGTTVTVTGTPVVSTFTTTMAGTTVTTTNANGQTITVTASPTTVTSTVTTTATGTAATASPSNFAVVDAAGNPVGYLSTSGTITQDAEDALTPQAATASAKRQMGLLDLFSSRSGGFFCGRGGDLSGQTSYIQSGACNTSTGAGANHTQFGYETTIFTIDSNTGTLSVFWVNNDGTTVPVTLSMGTFGGVPQTLLFVLDALAPVFDNGAAGTPLTAMGQNADEPASTFSSFSTPLSSSAASSSSVPLSSSDMSSMLSSLLPSVTDSSILPSMTSLNMSATSILPSTSDILSSMTDLPTPTLLSSSVSESSSATASSSSSAPSSTASVLAATDADGNVVGYFSVTGQLTQDANDALAPQAAQSAPAKRWAGLFGQKRATDQLINLYSPNTGNFLCGIGGDLTDDNFIASGGCDQTTFIGESHDRLGYETAIFSITNGALQGLWVNSDGTATNPVVFTYGTYQGVNNTLLFVKNAAAPVFDNGASGATVTAMAMPAPADDTTSSTDSASSTAQESSSAISTSGELTSSMAVPSLSTDVPTSSAIPSLSTDVISSSAIPSLSTDVPSLSSDMMSSSAEPSSSAVPSSSDVSSSSSDSASQSSSDMSTSSDSVITTTETSTSTGPFTTTITETLTETTSTESDTTTTTTGTSTSTETIVSPTFTSTSTTEIDQGAGVTETSTGTSTFTSDTTETLTGTSTSTVTITLTSSPLTTETETVTTTSTGVQTVTITTTETLTQ